MKKNLRSLFPILVFSTLFVVSLQSVFAQNTAKKDSKPKKSRVNLKAASLPLITETPVVYKASKSQKGQFFRIEVPQNQFVRLQVNQIGIDVKVEVRGPDNRLIREMDSLTGYGGVEEIQFVSQLSGIHRVEIIFLPPLPPQSQEMIEIWRDPFRVPNEQDRETAKAHDLLYSGLGALLSGDFNQARGKLEQALAIFSRYQCTEREAYTHFLLGQVTLELALATNPDPTNKTKVVEEIADESLNHFTQASDLWIKADPEKNKRNIALSLSGLAKIQSGLNKYTESISNSEKALATFQEVNDVWLGIDEQLILGINQQNIGADWRASLNLETALGKKDLYQYQSKFYLDGLIAMGFALTKQGKLEQALWYSNKALPLAELVAEKEDKHRLFRVLLNTGRTLTLLCRFNKAREYYDQALSLAEKMSDIDQAKVLLNFVEIDYLCGDDSTAKSRLDRIFDLLQFVDVSSEKAKAYLSRGVLVWEQNKNLNQALQDFDRAERVNPQTDDRDFQSVLEYNRGFAYYVDGEANPESYEKAETCFRSAHDKASNEEFWNPARLADSLRGLALVHSKQKKYTEAIKEIEEAINIFHFKRSQAKSFESRAFLMNFGRQYYESYLEIFFEAQKAQKGADFVESVFLKSDLAHSLSFFELLQESKQRGKEVPLSMSQREALDKGSPMPANLEDQARKLGSEYLPHPLPTLSQLQKSLCSDGKTVGLEYWLGVQKSYVWVITDTSIKLYELPPREKIEEATRTLIKGCNPTLESGFVSTEKVKELALELGKLILGPVSSDLKERLVVVPDGLLRDLPFAALVRPDTGEWLIDSQEIMTNSSFQVTYCLSGPDIETSLNPKVGVFTNNAISSYRSFADEIPERCSDSKILCRIYPLTFKSITKTSQTSYKMMVFATHGDFFDLKPWESGLQLSHPKTKSKIDNSRLTLKHVFSLRLKTGTLLLGACSQGREASSVDCGDDSLFGESRFGMVQGFLYAGADRVISSHWTIETSAIKSFLDKFYTVFLCSPTQFSPSKAMQLAIQSVKNQPETSHPAYWSAWTIQGKL